MITPAEITLVEMRRQDLLAECARARLVDSAASAAPVSKRRPLTLVRAYARYALAALPSVAFAMTTN